MLRCCHSELQSTTIWHLQLVYASAPSAIGGALITALGLGKKQTTTFEKPDRIVNQGSSRSVRRAQHLSPSPSLFTRVH